MTWDKRYKNSGVWNFQKEADKWGYLNNEEWSDRADAIAFSQSKGLPIELPNVHMPCGHWHLKPPTVSLDCNYLASILAQPHAWKTITIDDSGNIIGDSHIKLFGDTLLTSYRTTDSKAKVAVSPDLGLTWTIYTVPTMVAEYDVAIEWINATNWSLWTFGAGNYWWATTSDGGTNWTVTNPYQGEYFYGCIAISGLTATSSASVWEKLRVFDVTDSPDGWHWVDAAYPIAGRAFFAGGYLFCWRAAGFLCYASSLASDGVLVPIAPTSGFYLYATDDGNGKIFVTSADYYGAGGLKFHKSVNGGVDWTTVVADPEVNTGTTWFDFCGDTVYLASQITGILPSPQPLPLRLAYSFDQGVTWSQETVDNTRRYGGQSMVSNFYSIYFSVTDQVSGNQMLIYLDSEEPTINNLQEPQIWNMPEEGG
jgi:hypothetical protein